jgi:ubiquinone biosynthesis protein UbiJ
MIETPTDPVSQILIEIQDSISALRAEVGDFRRDNEAQHERIEGLIRKQRRDSAAMMIIMRSTVSDFDERVDEVMEQVAALEKRQS